MPIPDPLTLPPPELHPFGVGTYIAGGDSWSGTDRRVSAGAAGFAAAGMTPNLRTHAQQLNEYLGRVSDLYIYDQTTGLGHFGDASDGDQTEVGDRTLDRIYYYRDWTIDSGFKVTTAGYPVFVNGTLNVDGVGSELHWNGNPGILEVGGVAQTSTVLLGGVAGGDGLFGVVTPGADSTNTAAAGAGGAGGAGLGAAGLGGVATLADADTRSRDAAMRGATIRQGVLTALTAGAGGGGGGQGANAGINGGGGGSGAGMMVICARKIIIQNGGAINTIGGAGEPGIDGVGVDGGGGGGGGQGGLIYLIYQQWSDLIGIGGTVSVAGGAAGAAGPGTPAGTIGNVGGDGLIVSIPS